MTNSFTFYRDYYNLIDTLPNKEDKLILLEAITDYIFKDVEPNLNGHNLAIFNTLKAQLNVSKNNSGRGGRNKQKKTDLETDEKPIKEPIKEPITNPTTNRLENKTSVLSFKFYISNLNVNNNIKEILNKWIDYKKEIKDLYKSEIGFKTLVNKVIKYCDLYGEDKITDLINDAISNGYKGIVWDKIISYNKPKTQREKDQEFWERFDKELEDEKRRDQNDT